MKTTLEMPDATPRKAKARAAEDKLYHVYVQTPKRALPTQKFGRS